MKLSLGDYLRSGTAPRTPCVAALFQVAAHVSGTSMDELAAETALLTRALLDTHRLLGADSVAVRFDGVIRAAAGEDAWTAEEMNILDLPSSVPDLAATQVAATTMLDAVARLSAELKRTTPVIAYLPAPFAGEESGEWSTLIRALVEMACKAGAGMVMLKAPPEADSEALARHLKPISNVARYYAKPVLLVDAVAAKSMADAVILPLAADLAATSGSRIGRRLSPTDMKEGAGRLPVGQNEFAFIDDDLFAGRSSGSVTDELIALAKIIG